jgi:hypothetical protein
MSELSLLHPMFLLAFRTTVPSQLTAAASFQINGAIVFSAKGAHRQIRRGERSFLHGRRAARPVLSQLSIQIGDGFCDNVAGDLLSPVHRNNNKDFGGDDLHSGHKGKRLTNPTKTTCSLEYISLLQTGNTKFFGFFS